MKDRCAPHILYICHLPTTDAIDKCVAIDFCCLRPFRCAIAFAQQPIERTISNGVLALFRGKWRQIPINFKVNSIWYLNSFIVSATASPIHSWERDRCDVRSAMYANTNTTLRNWKRAGLKSSDRRKKWNKFGVTGPQSHFFSTSQPLVECAICDVACFVFSFYFPESNARCPLANSDSAQTIKMLKRTYSLAQLKRTD